MARTWLLLLLMLAIAVGAMTLGGSERAPYTFLFDRSKAADEQQRYMNTLVHDAGLSRDELEPIVDDMRRPARDLPVILFFARESGRPPAEVWALRKEGADWPAVMKELDIPVKRLFEGVKGTFPEPYKEAWVEWRMKWRPEFSEAQIRELVLLQTTSRITGRPVETVARERGRGTTAETMLARYRPPSPSPVPSPEGSPEGGSEEARRTGG